MRNKYGNIFRVTCAEKKVKEYVVADDEEDAFKKVCFNLNKPLKRKEVKIDTQEWNTQKGDIVKVYYGSSNKELIDNEGFYFFGIVEEESLMMAKVRLLEDDYVRVDRYLESSFVQIVGNFNSNLIKSRKMLKDKE